MELQKNKNSYDKLTKIAAMLAIVIILVFGIWTTMKVAPFLPSAVNRLIFAAVNLTQTFIASEKIDLTAETQELISGNSTSLSWVHRSKNGSGFYSLSYVCLDKSSLYVLDNGREIALDCKSNFDLPETENKINIKLITENTEVENIPVRISYTQLEDSLPQVYGEIPLRVLPKDAQIAPSENMITEENEVVNENSTTINPGAKSEKIYPISGTGVLVVSSSGKPDLKTTIFGVGTLDRSTNFFTPYSTTSLPADKVPAVSFEIENVGTASSGPWAFTVSLPTFPSYTFPSETQISLAPGEKIRYTLGFDNANANQDGAIVITADSSSSVGESIETNNVARIIIRPVAK